MTVPSTKSNLGALTPMMRFDPTRFARTAEAPPPWLAGCRAGEPAAIEALFAECLPGVERLLGRLVGASPDLEDLVHDTFAEVLRARPRFRGDARVSTWIASIAVHVAQHHLRAGRLRRYQSLEAVPDAELASEMPDHDRRLDERRLGQALYALLDRIAPNKRLALLLFAVDERPVEEVAALMGASQTATRSRVFFARRELRRLIAGHADLSSWANTLFGEPAREVEP